MTLHANLEETLVAGNVGLLKVYDDAGTGGWGKILFCSDLLQGAFPRV